VSLVPLFPLPNVVLFPGVLLPLHVFEPRYRALVGDALDGDRCIGMVLLRPGWESDYEGRPAIFSIACTGVIIHAVGLDDGRFNIVLKGLDRVRIVSEDYERPYRRAVVETLADPVPSEPDRQSLSQCRPKLEALIAMAAGLRDGRGTAPLRQHDVMPDPDFVHTLAQYSDLEPVEKQAILECEALSARAETLVEFLEMRRLQSTVPGAMRSPH
jgi:Lon protease-like protein